MRRQSALITGVSRGLGRALASRWIAEGHTVAGCSRGKDSEGRPLRKMFLRSPLRYSRITSRFSHRRFHPILKRHRPHYGVDYGAPTGTPVRVTGNGTVRRGRSNPGPRDARTQHASPRSAPGSRSRSQMMPRPAPAATLCRPRRGSHAHGQSEPMGSPPVRTSDRRTPMPPRAPGAEGTRLLIDHLCEDCESVSIPPTSPYLRSRPLRQGDQPTRKDCEGTL